MSNTVESQAVGGPMTVCASPDQKWALCKFGEAPQPKYGQIPTESKCPHAIERGSDCYQCDCVAAQKDCYGDCN